MDFKIIAEIAQGFEGSFLQAKLLIKAAASAGADAAKLQLVYADELATPDYKYFDLFKKLEMTDEEWASLAEFSSASGIDLHLDIFGIRSLKLAENIGATSVKLHGTDINNIGLLEAVANSGINNVTLGAGGAFKSEISQALQLLCDKKVVIMLGFQGYPTATECNQISRVALFDSIFGSDSVKIGFADHASTDTSQSYALATTALGAGAAVIEKHITLGKVMEMEDFEAALNPDEFSEFCDLVRDCTLAIGDSNDTEDFGMSVSELDYRKAIRRHVVSVKYLPEGSTLGADDLTLKRSSSTVAITDLNSVYGKVLKTSLFENQTVSLEHFINE